MCSEADWDKMLAVDLKGPFICSQAVAKQMIAQADAQQRGGAIINISSVHRFRCWPQDTVYGICKAGIARLTESMAFELGQHGIRVNAIAPGYIDSRVPEPRRTTDWPARLCCAGDSGYAAAPHWSARRYCRSRRLSRVGPGLFYHRPMPDRRWWVSVGGSAQDRLTNLVLD